MKVCCSSHSYDRLFATGDLTQLEWVDLCANELELDGVEFALAHFPRFDPDYVAQLKKLCVDRCLTVAGVLHDTPIDARSIDEHVERVRSSLDVACALGAPIVRCSISGVAGPEAIAWRETIRGLKAACVSAKERNITLALEPQTGSLVADAVQAKRAVKECDSAWLRLAPDASMLAQPSRETWDEIMPAAVIVVVPMRAVDAFGAEESVDYISAFSFLRKERFRGFLTLEYSGAEAERPAVARAVAWLRTMPPSV
ncbi:MAG TPA: sugar phosphate isomerase/epimerase family protein [Candidatus Acidoferrales bacterium]|nr:sugar phosphate isomerase/epimerase family protein [Candidatus Acidoferrales bacterium]